MPAQNTRNPEPKEIVGSKDLRESFKEYPRIRGSWYINDVELHQFEANSPASVVAQINAKTGAHFVTAEIDDGGHLVLIDNSGADIRIRQGAPFVEPPPIATGDAARDVLNHLKGATEREKKEEQKGVLDLLGLEGSEGHQDINAHPGFETGRSAEDRRKAREEQLAREQGIPASARGTPVNPNQPASSPGPGGRSPTAGPQIPSNPTPGLSGAAGGQLDDGRGRTGTGGGSGESSARTVQDQHSPQTAKPAPVPGA